MNLQAWFSLISRALFAISFVFLVAAVIEKMANVSGYTLIGEHYTPGRMLEFAAIMLLFVIVLLLRSIRDELKKT